MAANPCGNQQTGEVVQMTVDDAIQKLMTCESDLNCQKEEAYFVGAKYAQAMREQERTARAIEPSDPDPDTITHYAPCWENSRVDWSAA